MGPIAVIVGMSLGLPVLKRATARPDGRPLELVSVPAE
jgi:hypothetical protein